MARVTSGELQKEFGRYRTIAHKEALIVTNHGREDLVLLSADEYQRLRMLEHRAFHISGLTDKELTELSNAKLPVEAKQYNIEMDQ